VVVESGIHGCPPTGGGVGARQVDDRRARCETVGTMDGTGQAQVERRIGERLDAGDLRGAAEESVRGYGAEVGAYLRALLREEAAAEEVFSRVCEKLWRGLPSFRRQSSLRTWLYRLAWNAARDFQKEAARNPTRALRTTEISRIAAEIAASRPRFERSS